jgi:hypothetical protein
MKVRYFAGVLAAAFVAASVAAAQPPQPSERRSDNDVKKLFESVNQARDRFEDQLDGKVKNGVLRSATGEMQVSATLHDFQKDIEKMKERFTDAYAASTEVEVVLRRGGGINAMMKEQPATLKGASEWERLGAELRLLAAVYGADFPLAEGAKVRRMNDAEVASAAGTVATQAEQVKRAVDSDKTLAKPDKQSLTTDVNDVIKLAKTLQSKLKDGKPATADYRALKEKVASLTAGERKLPPAVLTAIGTLRAPLDSIDRGFGAAPSTAP